MCGPPLTSWPSHYGLGRFIDAATQTPDPLTDSQEVTEIAAAGIVLLKWGNK
jgi:hypothetical protein